MVARQDEKSVTGANCLLSLKLNSFENGVAMGRYLHLSEPFDQSRHGSGMDIKHASCIGGSLLPGRHQVFDFLLLVIVELRSSTADAACFARQSNPALVRSRSIALSNSANAPQSASSWAQRGGRVNRLGEAQKANPSCCRGRHRKRTMKHVEPMLYRWIPVSASA